jgi:hypothetical protein
MSQAAPARGERRRKLSRIDPGKRGKQTKCACSWQARKSSLVRTRSNNGRGHRPRRRSCLRDQIPAGRPRSPDIGRRTSPLRCRSRCELEPSPSSTSVAQTRGAPSAATWYFRGRRSAARAPERHGDVRWRRADGRRPDALGTAQGAGVPALLQAFRDLGRDQVRQGPSVPWGCYVFRLRGEESSRIFRRTHIAG